MGNIKNRMSGGYDFMSRKKIAEGYFAIFRFSFDFIVPLDFPQVMKYVVYLNYIDQVVSKFAESQQGAEMPRLVTTYLNCLLQAPLEAECYYTKSKEFFG